jgi:hypothetical protein
MPGLLNTIRIAIGLTAVDGELLRQIVDRTCALSARLGYISWGAALCDGTSIFEGQIASLFASSSSTARIF